MMQAPSSSHEHPVVERRRRGRPKHVAVPLEAMRRREGRPLTPRDLAGLAGMSPDKIRSLLKSGHLHGVIVPTERGARMQWRIPYPEAQRWLRELRVI